jgi:hypothetical protein
MGEMVTLGLGLKSKKTRCLERWGKQIPHRHPQENCGWVRDDIWNGTNGIGVRQWWARGGSFSRHGFQ